MADVKHSKSTLATIIENAKQQLEKMVDLNPQGMLLLDSFYQVMRGNEQALNLLGRKDFSDILGRSLSDLFDDDSPAAHALSTPEDDPKQTINVTAEIADRGERRLSFTIIRSKTNDQITVVILDDQTEKLEQATKDAEKNKLEAVQALSGALQHIINQPLTVIAIEAHLILHQLEAGELDEDALKHSLTQIIGLTTTIADTLESTSHLRHFVTTQYLGETDIVDIEESNKP